MNTGIHLPYVNNYLLLPPASAGDFPAASVIVVPVQRDDCKNKYSILWLLTIKGWFCGHKILLDLELS